MEIMSLKLGSTVGNDLADWSKLGECRQKQMDKTIVKVNSGRVDWDYQASYKVLVMKDGILHESQSQYDSEPWTITSVHTNDTIRIQSGTKAEKLNIRREKSHFE